MYFGRIQLLSIRLEGGNARAQLQEEEVKPVCSFLLLVMWTFLVCYLSFFRLLCREEVKEDHPDGWKIWNTSPRDHTTKARSFLSGSLVFFPNHKLSREIQLSAVQTWYFSILISKYLLCMVNASMVTVKCLVCIWKRRFNTRPRLQDELYLSKFLPPWVILVISLNHGIRHLRASFFIKIVYQATKLLKSFSKLFAKSVLTKDLPRSSAMDLKYFVSIRVVSVKAPEL